MRACTHAHTYMHTHTHKVQSCAEYILFSLKFGRTILNERHDVFLDSIKTWNALKYSHRFVLSIGGSIVCE